MPKKKRTRKQKEAAVTRREQQIQPVHIDTPTYSVAGLKLDNPIQVKETPKPSPRSNTDFSRKDITSIAVASGIVVAAEILLFVLLSTETIKLNFLGY